MKQKQLSILLPPLVCDWPSAPSIEQKIIELEHAGWRRSRVTRWVSPTGNFYLGPHGAWLALQKHGSSV